MKKHQQENPVTLVIARPESLPDFKRELQEAFSVAMMETFDSVPEEPIPSDEDIEESFNAPGAVICHFLLQGTKVDGAVLCCALMKKLNTTRWRFFLYRRQHMARASGTKPGKPSRKAIPKRRYGRRIHRILRSATFTSM